MGKGIEASCLEKLHKAGIAKSMEHVFVYRYPGSDSMPAMDAGKFAGDLKKKERKLAFYMHIPFCTSICSYCHYFKELLGEGKAVQGYLDSLGKEIAAYRELVGEKLEVESVLFGGGTPTTLEAGKLNGLMGFLKEMFAFGDRVEASIESSPETLSLEKLAELRQGFNRLSVGVQDFDDRVLKACNRNHSREQALKAIDDARNVGFGNVNIDLIYGLPGQGIEGWRKTLGEVEAIMPESVTASDLRIQKGTGFFGMDKAKFASEPELVTMHSMFLERMSELGYNQVFPYQFSLKGKEMRFLQNQWSSGEFMGFGASSCSYLSGWDYNNVFPVGEYVKRVSEQGLACAVGKKLSREEEMVRFVALGLKNVALGGVDKRRFGELFGLGIGERFGEVVRELEGLGLVENGERFLGLSNKGLLFYDAVSRKFFPKA